MKVACVLVFVFVFVFVLVFVFVFVFVESLLNFPLLQPVLSGQRCDHVLSSHFVSGFPLMFLCVLAVRSLLFGLVVGCVFIVYVNNLTISVLTLFFLGKKVDFLLSKECQQGQSHSNDRKRRTNYKSTQELF